MLLHSTFAFYPDKALRLLGLGHPHHPGKLLGFPPRDIHQSPKILVSRPKNVHLDENRDKEMKNKTRKKYEDGELPYILQYYFSMKMLQLYTFQLFGFSSSGYCNPFFVSAPGLSMTLLHFCVAAWHGSARWRQQISVEICGQTEATPWYSSNSGHLSPLWFPILPSIPGSSSSTGASTGLPQLVNSQSHLEDWWIFSTKKIFSDRKD